MRGGLGFGIFLCSFVTLVCHVSASETVKTPYGAELNGSVDGSIPAWQGNLENKEAFGPQLLNEKPLYIITAANLDSYRQDLPKGLAALIEQYPETMRIPVYKSYRPGYYPDWVYQAVEENRVSAQLTHGGDSIINTSPGIPFPDPSDGYQVLWNHLLAFKGVNVDFGSWETVVLSNRNTGIIKNRIKISMDYYDRERGKSDEKQMYLYYLSSVISPSRLAGSSLLVHERVNASIIPRQAWSYVAGQRRVMRVPRIDYDSLMPRSEGIRFADEVDLYNGSVDRYQWRIVGKQALVIPYNNEKLYEELREFDDIKDELLTPSHLNSHFLRYEKHRVWVIEGVLKEGKKHPYKKRVLYLDEDSWGAVLAENYDRHNQLWRVSVSYVKLYHELPAVFKVSDAFHDLRAKSYYSQGLLFLNGQGATVKSKTAKKKEFKPSVLRRMGKR